MGICPMLISIKGFSMRFDCLLYAASYCSDCIEGHWAKVTNMRQRIKGYGQGTWLTEIWGRVDCAGKSPIFFYFTFCNHFSIPFCELMYRLTSLGSPTMSLPLYITPPLALGYTGVVLLRVCTAGRLEGVPGDGAGVAGERKGDGEKGAVARCTALGRAPSGVELLTMGERGS